MRHVALLIIFNVGICQAQTTSLNIDTTKEAPAVYEQYTGKYIFKNGEAVIISMKEGELYLDPLYGVPFILEKIDTSSYFSEEKKIIVSFLNNENITVEKLKEGKLKQGKQIPYEETTPYEFILKGEPLKASTLYQQIDFYSIDNVIDKLHSQAQKLTYTESVMAISFYQTALKLDPENERIMRSLAAIYLRLMQDLYTLDTVFQQQLRQINEKLNSND